MLSNTLNKTLKQLENTTFSKFSQQSRNAVCKTLNKKNKINNCWYTKSLNNSIQLPEKFINLLMKNGNKIKAYNIFYKTLKLLEIKTLLNIQHFLPFSNNIVNKTESKAYLKVELAENDKFDSKILLFQAIENIKPSIEVRKVRSKGKTYQVPALIQKKKQETLAIRWIITSAQTRKKNSKNSFAECLALELLEASKKQGKAKQKRDELHQLAESNRPYLRFRWW